MVLGVNAAWVTRSVFPAHEKARFATVGDREKPPGIQEVWSIGSLNWMVMSCVSGTPAAASEGVCELMVGAVESIVNADVGTENLPPSPSMTVTSTRTFVASMRGTVHGNVFCPALRPVSGPVTTPFPALLV